MIGNRPLPLPPEAQRGPGRDLSFRDRLSRIPALTGTPAALDTDHLPAGPVEMFLWWLDEAVAADVPEPRSATLSTVDADGLPDARVLVLRDLGERGWAFGSTRSSRKGEQLAAQPAAALSMWWQPQMRAVRLRGPVVEASREESDADLARRHPDARARIADGDWQVWWLRPQRVEFWQGAQDRGHTRIIYTRTTEAWTHEVTSEGSN
ncbi:MAG: pyridoxamine 5'-phosphate oxidase family protein [Mobilicoccus sp.]|nr:pyridoxamine 5'-phosphate oxidase family protein [Mobilicoccus sp.]